MKKYRLLLLFVSTSLFAADPVSGNSVFTVDEMPTQYQLYARNSNDSSRVIYAGSTTILNIDSVFLKTYKNDVLIEVQSRKLFYSEGSATFNLGVNIHAELSKYSFQLLYQKQGQMFIDHEVTDIVCGDVLIIHGQSNAEATRSWAGTTEKKKNESITIYPNPASGTVHIHGLNENSTINLTNLAGSKLRQFYLHYGIQSIELAGLEPGIYLLVFENMAIHKKIMIL